MAENKLGVKPVLPLIVSMSLPPMLSMFIQSMYNIVDSIFVARYSEDAMTALSLAFPVQNLILAIAVGIGVGINSYISRNLGAKQYDEANSAVTHGLIMTAFHSALLIIFSFTLLKPFFSLFESGGDIFDLSVDYAFIVTSLSSFSLFHILLEKVFQAAGKMFFPMILQIIGAVVNIILDPIFIFTLNMGVKGAAYATVIGQAVSMILTLIIFVTGNHGVKIKIRGFKFSLGTVGKIYAVGLPSSIMLSVASVLVMALNKLLITFSQTAVSLFGIYYKIQTFVYMPSSGLIQGIRPIIGYNYGAGSRKRIKECIRLSLVIVGIIMVAGSLLFSLFPAQILKVFNASDDMLSIGMPALRIISSSYIFAAVGIVFSAVFEAMGKGMYSLTVSLLRQFAITVPLAYLLSLPMGLNGIWISFPIAEFFGAAASVFLYIKLINKDKIMLKNN